MKYFTIAELCKSDTADKQGIDNRLPKDLLPNVRRLIAEVLDPLREWYGKPIYINSGYRCESLNKAVGGVDNSFHLTGCAADIAVNSYEENGKLFEYIKENLPFTELGWEGGGAWVHVALVPGREEEREVFYA